VDPTMSMHRIIEKITALVQPMLVA
jgi:hypothetical protein